MTARPVRRPAIFLALGALTLATLSACSSGNDTVDVGDVRSYGSGAAEGTEVSVTVPLGTVEAVVGEPVEEIGDLRAPDGGSLVRVATRFRDAQVRSDVWDLAARAGSARAVVATLNAAGQDYPLGVVRDGDGTDAGESVRAPTDLVVALEGTPEEIGDDLVLAITYDELTQTVSLPEGERAPGRADALYEEAADPSALPVQECDARVEPARAAVPSLACEVGAVRALPYVPDLGWAAEGTTWLVVGAGIEVPAVELDGARYAAASIDLSVRADGEEPALVLDATDRSGRGAGQHVFSVPADSGATRLELDARCALRLEAGDGSPAARRLRVSAAVDVEPPPAPTGG